MRAYIGVQEKECKVKAHLIYGEVEILSVRDAHTGLDVRGYLDQGVLDRLAQDWLIEREGEGRTGL